MASIPQDPNHGLILQSALPNGGGGGGGGVVERMKKKGKETFVKGCAAHFPISLPRFKTKICDCPYPIYDLNKILRLTTIPN